MKCKICQGNLKKIFEHQIMGKYIISYYRCVQCRVILTEQPFWLDEAYSENRSIVDIDTGIMVRNISFCKVVNAVLDAFFTDLSSFVDYGGGYGVFVRMMRDLGWNFEWYDKFSPNLFARGFEYGGGQKGSFDSV